MVHQSPIEGGEPGEDSGGPVSRSRREMVAALETTLGRGSVVIDLPSISFNFWEHGGGGALL